MKFNNDNDVACTETSANEINADTTEEDSSLLDINCTETSASDINADSTEGDSSLLDFNLLKEVIDSSIVEVIKNDGIYVSDGSWIPNVKPLGDLSKPPVSKAHAKTLGSTRHEIGYYQGLAHVTSMLKKMSKYEADTNDKYLFSEKNHNRSRTLMLDYYNSHPTQPKGFSLSAITEIAAANHTKNRHRVDNVFAPPHEKILFWDVKRDATGRATYRAGEGLIYFWDALHVALDGLQSSDEK